MEDEDCGEDERVRLIGWLLSSFRKPEDRHSKETQKNTHTHNMSQRLTSRRFLFGIQLV